MIKNISEQMSLYTLSLFFNAIFKSLISFLELELTFSIFYIFCDI